MKGNKNQVVGIIVALAIMAGVFFLGTPTGRDLVYEAGNGIVNTVIDFIYDIISKDSNEPNYSEDSYGVIGIGEEQPGKKEPKIDGFN